MPNPLTMDFYQTVTPVRVIGKIRNYITLPAFSEEFDWQGVTTVVAEYQYETTKNFTLHTLPDAPSGINFTLCIKYRFDDGEVVRYSLWTSQSEDASLPNVPAYTGQIIKKHFTLEIWSSSDDAGDNPVVLEDDVIFNLSILSLRAALSDSSTIENAEASDIVTDLDNTNAALAGASITVAQAFPLVVSSSQLFGYYDGTGMDEDAGYVPTWFARRTNMEDNIYNTTWNLETAGLKPTRVSSHYSINNNNYLNMLGAAMYAGSTGTVPYTIVEGEETYGLVDENGRAVQIIEGTPVGTLLYNCYTVMVMRQNSWTLDDVLYQLMVASGNNFEFKQSGGGLLPGLTYAGSNSNTGATLGKWCIVELFWDTDWLPHVVVTDLKTQVVTEVTGAFVSPVEISNILFGDAASDFDVAALGIYVNTSANPANFFLASQRVIIKNYLSYQFGGPMGLPLIYTTTQNGIAN